LAAVDLQKALSLILALIPALLIPELHATLSGI